MDFGKTAQRLARNPLGIVALFITLVYGFAALSLGLAATDLSSSDKQPLIWFLVVFPVLLLGVFFRLVTHHHTKLYGPGDYPDQRGFHETLALMQRATQQEQREKLDTTVAEIQTELTENAERAEADAPAEQPPPFDLSSTEARIRLSNLLAENLVIRELEEEFDSQVFRQVRLAAGKHNGRLLDGAIFTPDGRRFGLEIRYAPAGKRLEVHAMRMIASEQQAHMNGELLVPMILAVVGENLSADQLAAARHETDEHLNGIAEFLPHRPQIRFYDLARLREKYGLDDAPSAS